MPVELLDLLLLEHAEQHRGVDACVPQVAARGHHRRDAVPHHLVHVGLVLDVGADLLREGAAHLHQARHGAPATPPLLKSRLRAEDDEEGH